MKKTKRFLSSLLACLMVLSVFPAFVSADDTATTESTPEAFFCDFDAGFTPGADKSVADEEFKAAGFTKGMALNYSSLSDGTGTNSAARVVEDTVLGKAWQTPAGPTMHLGVGFDNPVTSGAVKLSFTVKANSAETFPYIDYSTAMGTAYGKAETVKAHTAALTTDSNGAYIALFDEANSTDTNKFKRFNNDEYYDIELVVDVDNNARRIYVDGVMIDECIHTTPIAQMQGFYFVHTSTSSATPKVDNILLTAYDADSENMNLVKTVNGDGKVKLVFDEVIDDTGLTAADITFKEAGGTNNVAPSAIKVIGNTLEITFDASTATAGREYILTSDKLKSVNGTKGIDSIPFILKAVEEKNETIHADDFDDIKPENYVIADPTTHRLSWNTETATSTFMTECIYPMAYDANKSSTNWGNAVNVYPVDWDKYRPDDKHGIVLNATGTVNFVLAHNQNTSDEYGVEVYEFDFAGKDTGRTKFNVYRNQYQGGVSGNRYDGFGDLTYSNDGTWKKVKVVYDTVNGTLQLFLDANMDGTYEKQSHLDTNFATKPYQGLDMYYSSGAYFDTIGDPDVIENGDTTKTTWAVLDNLNSYILYTPLVMEGVRFVDALGSETLSDTDVDSGTAQIKVNFSEAVTEASIAGITVKDSKDVNKVTAVALSADGKSAILTVAGLDPKSTYTINVPATVKAASNTPATAATYTFTTGDEGEYKISDLKLVGENGEEFITLPVTTNATNGDTVKVTADVENTVPGSKKVTVIYALYNGTTLVDANFGEITLTASTTAIDETFTTKPGIEFTKCKAFIWDGITSAVPLVTSYEK